MNSRSGFNLKSFDSFESQQERLHLFSKAAEIGDWCYTFSTNFTVWSEYLYQFYEVGKDFECSHLLESTYYSESEKEKMRALIARVTIHKEEHSGEFLVNMPDGRVKWHTTTLYPMRDTSGDIIGLYGVLQNISARKKNELELQRMAYVAEKTNGIVMITDPERKIIWINHSFEEILGYKAEEVMGIDPAAFLQGPETSRATIQEIARSLKSTGTFSGEILNYTKSGEKIWLYLNIAAVYDDTGKLINYVAVENDITLIKMAEQRLQKAMKKERELNRFKTQFVRIAVWVWMLRYCCTIGCITNEHFEPVFNAVGNAGSFSSIACKL